MSTAALNAGFMRLVDAAPLIVAHEFGFAEEEGLALNLRAAPSSSTMRDWLAYGQIDVGQLLAPMPVAAALGIGGVTTRFDVLLVTSVGGNTIGVSTPLAKRLRDAGHDFGFADAAAAGRALFGTCATPRIRVPFPFSMHTELVSYWTGRLQPAFGPELRTVPPTQLAAALKAGKIDAFCASEPWGSLAVEAGLAELLLPSCAIWSFAPDKVLAARHNWVEGEPERTGQLMRAVWRAARWLGSAQNHGTAAETLARPAYLDVSAEVIERALSGTIVVSTRGDVRRVPGFLEFFAGAAPFPWKSQAAWIADRMAARLGLERTDAMRKARAIFRTDLYRRHLKTAGADMPGASEKVEGALDQVTAVASDTGGLFLQPNRFFDRETFDLFSDS